MGSCSTVSSHDSSNFEKLICVIVRLLRLHLFLIIAGVPTVMNCCFNSVDGKYTATSSSFCKYISTAEDLWFYSVGKRLKLQSLSAGDIFRAYTAANVGVLRQDSVSNKLRLLKKLPGRIEVNVIFTPEHREPAPQPTQCSVYNATRQVARGYRREAENHLESILVLIGVLFASGRRFRLANRILGNMPRRMCAGRPTRARSKLGDTTFPMFHDTEHFYDKLLAYATTSIGSSIRCGL